MKRDDRRSILAGTLIKILAAVLVILALIFVARRAYSFGYSIFAEEALSSSPGKKCALTITDDMSARDIARLLEERGVIENASVFWFQYQLSEYRGEILPGSYIVSSSQTPEELLEILCGVIEEETESG